MFESNTVFDNGFSDAKRKFYRKWMKCYRCKNNSIVMNHAVGNDVPMMLKTTKDGKLAAIISGIGHCWCYRFFCFYCCYCAARATLLCFHFNYNFARAQWNVQIYKCTHAEAFFCDLLAKAIIVTLTWQTCRVIWLKSNWFLSICLLLIGSKWNLY